MQSQEVNTQQLFVNAPARLVQSQQMSTKAISAQKMTPVMQAVPEKSQNPNIFAKAAETFGNVAQSINQEINYMVGGENQYAELAGTGMKM